MKRLIKLLFISVTIMMLSSIPVFATEGGGGGGTQGVPESAYLQSSGDAIKDILLDDRFSGALDTISVITEFIDIWFIRIISLVSFFIISAAMLKNVCAGAYVANDKFWDKVHDAHQKLDAVSIESAKNFFTSGIKSQSYGGIRDFLLCIVPDIKSFTDFEDADIEPKAYFMKAIPQMLVCVCIGVFIYNGFYRDTAAKVGEMGSVLVDRTLNSVNPESLVNSIFNTESWPPIPWEGDPSVQGQLKLAVAKELKSIASSNFSDIQTAAQKTKVMQQIVNAIDAKLPSDEASYAPPAELGEGYIYKVSNVQGNATADTTITNEGPTPQGNGDVNYLYKFPLNELVVSTTETSSTQVAYIRFTMKLDVSNDKQQLLSTMSSTVTGGSNDVLTEVANTLTNPTISTSSFPGLVVGANQVNGLTGLKLDISMFGVTKEQMRSLVWDGTVGDTTYNNGTITFNKDFASLTNGNTITVGEIQAGRGKKGLAVTLTFSY